MSLLLIGVVAMVVMLGAGTSSSPGGKRSTTASQKGAGGVATSPNAGSGPAQPAPASPSPDGGAGSTAVAGRGSAPPSPEQVRSSLLQLISGIQTKATNSNGTPRPITREEAEALVRAQLEKLGINP